MLYQHSLFIIMIVMRKSIKAKYNNSVMHVKRVENFASLCEMRCVGCWTMKGFCHPTFGFYEEGVLLARTNG